MSSNQGRAKQPRQRTEHQHHAGCGHSEPKCKLCGGSRAEHEFATSSTRGAGYSLSHSFQY